MNHFLLAQGGARNDVKYGAYAMEMLINRLLRAGAQRSAFQCKVFGGATLSGFGNEIGRANAAFARKFLADEEIACVAESLGGGSAAPHQIQPDHRESANAFCTACRRRTGDTASRNCHTRHNNVLTVGMLSTSPPTHGR
ncbi:hypothetical protein [Sulfitobacter guttiformis]|nr:hypothetical protein [Sulfitobacter guttiformis]